MGMSWIPVHLGVDGSAFIDRNEFSSNGDLQATRIGKVDRIWTKDLGGLLVVEEALSPFERREDERGAGVVWHDLHWVLRAQSIGAKDGCEWFFGAILRAVELQDRPSRN